MSFRIWTLSDLHLEHSDNRGFRPRAPSADLLIVAGDVQEGDVVTAISVVDEIRGGTEAIFVAGNHEHWGWAFEDVEEAGRAQAKRRGVHYLDRDVVEIGGLKIAGAPLWFGLRLPEDVDRSDLTKIMSGAEPANFPNLPFEKFEEPVFVRGPVVLDRRAKYSDVDFKHRQALMFLFDAKPDVVVTHYPPPESALKALPDVRLWIHGHIHRSMDDRRGRRGTRILCNPRGAEVLNPTFRDDLVVEI